MADVIGGPCGAAAVCALLSSQPDNADAASHASAIAAIAPQQPAGLATGSTNVTVIEKNQAFPLIGPLVVERCQVEDCSDSAT